MADPHVAQTSDRRIRDRREGNGGIALGTRKLAWLPLSLVVFSLAGLAITPLLLQRRTHTIREEVRSVAEPGRLLLGELRLGLARELSLAQRFALTRESSQWFAYHRAAARDDSLVARLDFTLRGMGASARAAMIGIRQSIARWRLISAVDDKRESPDLLRLAVEHGMNYEDLLLSTIRADSAVARAMQSRRVQIDHAEELQLDLAIAFVLVGCVATAAVLVLTLRDRHLRLVLRRRAEEEASLRRLAASLSGAFSVKEVAELTVTSALNSSRVGGAYLTRATDGHLITIAGRGSCAPAAGTKTRVPSWLSEGDDRDHPRIFTTEVRASAAALAAGCDRRKAGSLLVVPLRHNEDVIGTLGIASAGGRRQLGESSLRFGRALGDLAAVALHRADALESEQHARAEAEQAVRTRDAVVSIVSHDLRNPLMAVLGTTELLLELVRGDGHELERSQLATLKHAADSMNRLIRDLLDVTRLESGPLPIRCSRLEVDDVIEGVVEMFRVVAGARRITLLREAPSNMPAIFGDRDRLEQALSNLVANAVKFTPNGGQVRVITELHAEGVRICVRDTGPGIPNDQIPHLFDRYWQASRNDTRGLGLGLSIVKAIVEAHGGRVEVQSVLENGSNFCIVLPAAAVESATTTAPPVRTATRSRVPQRTGTTSDGPSAPAPAPVPMMLMKSTETGDASRS